MNLRIKEVAKTKGISLKDLAKRLGVTYQALNARMKGNPTITALSEIAEGLNCSVHELIEVGEDYSHFYDTNTGEWLGIRKK